MKKITFGELLDKYISISGEEVNREQLSLLEDWIVTYEKQNGEYDVVIEPPADSEPVAS